MGGTPVVRQKSTESCSKRQPADFECNRLISTVTFIPAGIRLEGSRVQKCYPLPMPIRIAVMCERCERIYLLAHPDSAKRIQFTHRSHPHPPYRLTCICRMDRYFDRAQTLACRVSEDICSRGYADRDEYDIVPNQKFSVTRGS